MTYTFDEVIKRLSQDIDKNGGQEKYQKEVIATLKLLQKEYAPTVEMTKEQRDLILRSQDGDKLYEIMGNEDGYYFDSLYWGDLETHEVAQAYLRPETIKVVDK